MQSKSQSQPALTKVLKTVAGSFSLCLIVCMVGFEALLDYCPSNALQFLGPNQLKDRPPVLTKLANYDKVHAGRPTVLLVGSSLAQYASNLCDFGVFGAPDLNKEFATYARFRYLDKLLLEKTTDAGQHYEVANMSNSGAMLSEDFLIIKEAFAGKNPPKAVVLEIGPRDFIDNMTPDPYRSRLSQVLSKHQEPFNWRLDRSVTENVDITAEKTSLFYSMRGELHDCLVKIACDTLHHPASVYQATIMAKLAPPPVSAQNSPAPTVESATKTAKPTEAGGGTIKFGHIDDAIGSEAMKQYSVGEYHGRYLPINNAKWPVEVGCLKQIITYCKTKQIPLVLVNMPLTERNLAVLPDDFRVRYEKTIGTVCADAKAESNSTLSFVDLRNDRRFVVTDFRDTCHMRSVGGKKLAEIIAPILKDKLPGKINADAGSNAKFASKSSSLN
jgi:hypothetical protein